MKKWFCEEQSNGLKTCYLIKKKILSKKSKYQHIELFETVDFGKMLVIDGYIMQIEAFEKCYHEMIAHVPLFSHPNPQKILIIGGGDGGTSRECVKHKNVMVLLCEVDKDVIDIASKYLKGVKKVFTQSNHKITISNGFKYIKDMAFQKEKFDVVIVDVNDPLGISAPIYSDHFYKTVSSILKKDGILCTIGSTPFGEMKTVKQIFQRLRNNFRNVKIFTASVPMYQSGLWTFFIASKGNIRFFSKRCRDSVTKMDLSVYNGHIHAASFSLSNFLKKGIGL